MQYDLTLSVWNLFFSKEQCEGFSRAGLSVEWIGNRKATFPFTKGHLEYVSTLWTDSARFLPPLRKIPYWFEFSREMSRSCFDWLSGLHSLRSKMLWAYCERNTRLIAQAKRKKIPVMLDVPIGHQRDYFELKTAENAKFGIPYPLAIEKRWVRKCEWAYANADWITIGASHAKKTLVNRGIPSEKIIVNHYGVDGSLWRSSYENKCASDDKMIFIYTATVDLRKGIHYLLAAWQEAALPDAELWIAGGSAETVERFCGALPKNVKAFGRRNHNELKKLYSQVHVYCLPSSLEGLARSGIEAMAAGLPLLITEETGLTDFCEDGKQGWVVPARDVEALVEKLRWCREHPDEVKLAGAEAFAVGSKQTFESYGNRCAAVAKAIISGGDPRTVEGIKT